MIENHTGILEYKTVKNGHSLLPGRYAGLLNIVDGESEIPLHRIVTLYLIPLTLAGCFGNFLIFYVIVINKHMHTTINFYLLSQTISDFMVFMSFSLNAIYCMNLPSAHTPVSAAAKILKLVHTMGNNATVLIKMAIAFDRYIAICHPLMSSKIQSRRRTVKIIFVILNVAFLTSTGFIACVDIPELNCPWTEMYFRVEFPCKTLLPVAFIAIMYAMIGLKIRKSSQLFEHSGNKMDYKRRGIDISVVAIVEYFICWMPISLILLLYTYDFIDMSQVYRNRICLLVALSLFFLSSVMNPVLYSLMCLKFRRAFKDLLTCSRYQECNHNAVVKQGIINQGLI